MEEEKTQSAARSDTSFMFLDEQSWSAYRRITELYIEYGLFVLVAGTTLLRGGVDSFPRILTFYFILSLFAAACLKCVFESNRYHWRSTLLDRPAALFLVLSLVAALFSLQPILSAPRVLYYFSLLMVFYTVVIFWRKQEKVYRLCVVFTVLAFFLCIKGLAAYVGDLFRGEGAGLRLHGPFVNANHFAGFIELSIPFVLALFLYLRNAWGRLLAGYVLLTLIVSIVLTGSRGGMVSLGAAALLVLVLPLRRERRPVNWIGAAVFAGLVVFILAKVGVDPVVNRLVETGGPEREYIAEHRNRLNLYRAGMEIVRDHPLLGTGPGTFQLAFPAHRPPTFYGAPHYAHNILIGLASEMGLLAVLLAAWILYALYATALRERRKNRDQMKKFMRTGALLGITAMAVHSLVDFCLMIPADGILFAVNAGLLCGYCESRRGERRHSHPSYVKVDA